MRSSIVAAVAAVTLLLVTVGPLSADPPSWSNFDPASVSGVHLTPEDVGGNPGYFLHIDLGATLNVGTTPYPPLNWIQAFFLVAATDQTEFTATEGPLFDWFWEAKSKPGQIAGWVGDGQERVYPSSDGAVGKHLAYDTLAFTPGSVLAGYHIGYGTGEDSGWFKVSAAPGPGPGPNPVPEPSSLAGIAMAAVTAIAATRRRR